MARVRNPDRIKAEEIYINHKGDIELVKIAEMLDRPPGTIRGWKNKDSWDGKLNGTFQLKKQNAPKQKKRKKGGQPNNKNAVGYGAPQGNKNNERHGFFSKWLPEETAEIMNKIQSADPLDLLWDNIQLQYTAIIRAQKLMYVKDREDSTTTQIAQGYSDSGSSEKWEVQQAWDKHATFLNAQSRAMKTMESMIKQYDEMLNRRWDLATEEQKLRIKKLKVDIEKVEGNEEELSKLDKILERIDNAAKS